MIVFLLVFLLSSWSWEIFSRNLPLFLLLFLTSLFCYLSLTKPKKLYSYVFLLLLVLVLFFQYQTTAKSNIITLSPIEQYQLETRRDYYPSQLARIEENKQSLRSYDLKQSLISRGLENKASYLFYKLQQNFFRNVDLNLFFFGNHPRERVGVREFEKFSFLFLPFFFIGLITTIKKFNPYILIGLMLSIIELSIIGQQNYLGPFVLMPFFISIISLGISNTFSKLMRFKKS